jgi:hypothetical protein
LEFTLDDLFLLYFAWQKFAIFGQKCLPNNRTFICDFLSLYGEKKGGGAKGRLILELQKGGNQLVKIRQNIVLINQTFDCVINRT